MADGSADDTASGAIAPTAPSYPPLALTIRPNLPFGASSGSGPSDGGIDDWQPPWSPERDALYPNDWTLPWTPANEPFFPNDWTSVGSRLAASAHPDDWIPVVPQMPASPPPAAVGSSGLGVNNPQPAQNASSAPPPPWPSSVYSNWASTRVPLPPTGGFGTPTSQSPLFHNGPPAASATPGSTGGVAFPPRPQVDPHLATLGLLGPLANLGANPDPSQLGLLGVLANARPAAVSLGLIPAPKDYSSLAALKSYRSLDTSAAASAPTTLAAQPNALVRKPAIGRTRSAKIDLWNDELKGLPHALVLGLSDFLTGGAYAQKAEELEAAATNPWATAEEWQRLADQDVPPAEDTARDLERGVIGRDLPQGGALINAVGRPIGNPATWIGPGTTGAKLVGGVLAGIGGEVGGDVGEQLAGANGQIIGSLIGGVVGAKIGARGSTGGDGIRQGEAAAGSAERALQRGVTEPGVGPVQTGEPPALRAGRLDEVDHLDVLNSAGKFRFTPTEAQIDSAAFKVIVGDVQRNAQGKPVGTIYDATIGNGLGEIKTGSSSLDSSYQLRLQTYGALINDRPLTIYSDRKSNPVFGDWLPRWGVAVKPLPK